MGRRSKNTVAFTAGQEQGLCGFMDTDSVPAAALTRKSVAVGSSVMNLERPPANNIKRINK